MLTTGAEMVRTIGDPCTTDDEYDEYETGAATEYAAGLDSNKPDGLAAATAKRVAKTNWKNKCENSNEYSKDRLFPQRKFNSILTNLNILIEEFAFIFFFQLRIVFEDERLYYAFVIKMIAYLYQIRYHLDPPSRILNNKSHVRTSHSSVASLAA